jgi:hypothetical protein
MDTLKKSNVKLETLALSAFFILWGITEMFKFLPEGIGTVGIGVILVGLNLVRYWTHKPVSRFTTLVGVLALVLGAYELARPYLHLQFDLPVFAMLLMVIGVMLLGDAMVWGKKNE